MNHNGKRIIKGPPSAFEILFKFFFWYLMASLPITLIWAVLIEPHPHIGRGGVILYLLILTPLMPIASILGVFNGMVDHILYLILFFSILLFGLRRSLGWPGWGLKRKTRS